MDPAPDQDTSPTLQPYASAQFGNVVTVFRELQHPTQIGPYSILELVGEGGMGSVYKAEQRSPIHRIVAIKIVKLGMDTRDVTARFESERQALALMDHPNVARVLDAGATETGRPYFVMEYVKGEPITTFADRHKLNLRQRLELFTQACAAVQHAHQKAIIHRDLKPSNILVTLVDGKPQVKVIDFGIAKAISQRLTEKTLFTHTGQLLGTPEYMAPEQAEGSALLDVDTRSDVYSLGVVLYELLSGALPFDAPTLRSGGYQEIQRIIREVDPPRPSTRLSRLGKGAQEVARLRQTPLESLERQLRSELELIPLKAMHKDRARRYASATELAEDIRNYLSQRPLRAAPDSAVYHLRKFLRRNKGPVAAAGAVLLVLVCGVAATSWQAYRATRAEASIRAEQQRTLEQKREAEARRAEAEGAKAAAMQVNSFLVDMLQSPDPSQAQGKEVLVRDVLDKAAADVATKFAGQPRVEAAVRSALGQTYFALALYSQAEPHVIEALALYRRLGGDDDRETLLAQQKLGLLRHRQGRLEDALAIYRDTFDRRRRVMGEDHSDTIGSVNDIAVMLQRLGKNDEAEVMYRNARDRYQSKLGPDDPETLRVTGNLGQLLTAMGRLEEAESELRASYDGRRRVLGDDHPDTLSIQSQLANTIRNRGRYEEAEALMRDAYDRSRRVFGEDHAYTMIAEQGLAIVLGAMQRYDESIHHSRHALARSRKSLGNEDLNTLVMMRSLGIELIKSGRPAEAEALLRESLAGQVNVIGTDHPRTVMTRHTLAICLQSQERWEEALPLTKEVFEQLRPAGRVQLDPKQRAEFLAPYGIGLSELGRHAEALGPLIESRAALVELKEPSAQVLHGVLSALVTTTTALGHADDAARYSAEQAAMGPTTTPATPASTRPAG